MMKSSFTGEQIPFAPKQGIRTSLVDHLTLDRHVLQEVIGNA